MTLRPSSRQRGASLIEVLIALFLVAFTMLGLLSLQLRSQTFQKDSIDRRNAAVIASDFLERAAANFTGFRGGRYDGLSFDIGAVLPPAPGPCATADVCTDAELVARDWYALRRNVSRQLPGGIAFVTSPVLAGGANSHAVEVTVGWIDPSRQEDDVPADRIVSDGGLAGCPLAVNAADQRYRCYTARAYP
jgi:type IV pilus assembly protein PilV